jgi:hypothetical protein
MGNRDDGHFDAILRILHYHHTPLLPTQTKNAGIFVKQKKTVYEFCSQIDLGGSVRFCAGFAMLLLPLTLASTTTSRWRTPYLDILIALAPFF